MQGMGRAGHQVLKGQASHWAVGTSAFSFLRGAGHSDSPQCGPRVCEATLEKQELWARRKNWVCPWLVKELGCPGRQGSPLSS